ncbi:MAG: hypothetical protein A2Y67_01680 [Candidatus Buchananbacteria bacterium RBG_13_39_9]|uniref:Uncharacterized protein n=1 Tax=Candidatus Buchananbacteria bacterium RBG_13_39_9 TaxID=1797531 RepID=A0A1G1XRI6_9BACT|nr:MAG: hypothetical protein A2Y67_01680 [Candidatus Buchananbacteria bacterium RBG_13_39_9]
MKSKRYQIQVIKYDGTWSNPVWDSGKTEFNTNVLEGDRTEDISYGGEPLHLDGMKYNWRIKLWDDEDNEGEWTNGNDFFVMAGKRIQDLTYYIRKAPSFSWGDLKSFERSVGREKTIRFLINIKILNMMVL